MIPRRDTATTMAEVAVFCDPAMARHGPIRTFGIGSSSPLDLDPGSSRYGRIATTPKTGGRNTDMPALSRRHFSVPLAIDTDENVDALADYCSHRHEDATPHRIAPLRCTQPSGLAGDHLLAERAA
jgi:fructokinase